MDAADRQKRHALCKEKSKGRATFAGGWSRVLGGEASVYLYGEVIVERTTRIQRIIALVLVAAVGLNEIFHAMFDGLQFMSNVEFVGSVLSMESTLEPDSWRAIESPALAFIAYGLIWLAHAASGVLCLVGALFLGRAAGGAPEDSSSPAAATAGVGIGCVLYLLGFQSIAGGWFLLFQAPTPPNFIPQATQLFLSYAAVLIYLQLVTRYRVAA
jgi:predicted small integral membrane protein